MNLKKKGKSVNHTFHAAAILPTAVLSIGLTVPAPAAHATIAQPEEIVVTARRTEEVIQNVPISMTVFNQEMLNERNVSSGTDLVAYTPSLNVNTRFGSDQASFAIRGFTQELRTTASVAVYFADVVAPRGGGSITAGDGAGPGSFFDLQNVQVLKGPQGTLFGRNTTGGAIQLVPQEPTNKLEGYLEESAGNYNMRRTQGVINVPLSDTVRARFGVDAQKRDGYIKNASGIGPNHFSNMDYIAARGSLIVDVTDKVQNYTILTYTNSQNNGTVQGMYKCNPDQPLGQLGCAPQLERQGTDFYTVMSDTRDPVSELKQWQAINTTTWNVSDDFTVKNILSYAKLKQSMRTSVFGSNFQIGAAGGALAGTNFTLYPSSQWSGLPTNAQKTAIEELQFQGTALQSKLTWQAGLYLESSKPDGWSGSLSPILLSCSSDPGNRDVSQWSCADFLGGLSGGLFSGIVQSNVGKIEYLNKAIYSQATYDISDEFRVTAGLRYTADQSTGISEQSYYTFSQAAYGAPLNQACLSTLASGADCRVDLKKKSEAPTWLIDFDYLPTPDVMIYAKYARGYRQGSVNIFGLETFQEFDPEKVDAYEIGEKTTFQGQIPGTFNISVFYNELKNQQLDSHFVPDSSLPSPIKAAPTTAIINAGASTIQGIEVETTLRLLQDLSYNLSYTYLETHVDQLAQPVTPQYLTDRFALGNPQLQAEEGGHLAFSPRHTVTTGLSYRLPFPAEIGDISVGGSYTFTSSQLSTAPGNSPDAELGLRKLVNLNLGWKAIMGSSFDAAAFVTNLTQQKYVTYVAGTYNQAGFESRVVGEPRMAGVRIKYNFQ